MDTNATTSFHWPACSTELRVRAGHPAAGLQALLQAVPRKLTDTCGAARYPLLTALTLADQREGASRARRLLFYAATVHHGADERRTAEYVLRHRDRAVDLAGTVRLIGAARCAAEMDVRRVGRREVSMPAESMRSLVDAAGAARTGDPSVGERVVEFLDFALGDRLSARVRGLVIDAVVTFLEVAARHAAVGGGEPSVLAMRPAARRPARLVTYLRELVGDPVAARCLARLLIGPDGTAIETGLLWWVARGDAEAAAVPVEVLYRWRRDLQVLTDACAESTLSAAR